MSKKLTPWFDHEVKPVRKGVYVTEFDIEEDGFSRWNGSKWSNQRSTAHDAARADFDGAIQEKRWRGMAEKPALGVAAADEGGN